VQEVILPHKNHNFHLVHKFGMNEAVGSAEETVWSQGGLYPWALFDSGAITVYARSTSTGDTSGVLELQGLDENYNIQVDSISLAGQSLVPSAKQFTRVFRARFRGESHAGALEVYATNAVNSANIVAHVPEAQSSSEVAIYTVPRNHIARLTSYTVSASKNVEAGIRLKSRLPGQSFTTESLAEVFQSSLVQEFPKGLQFKALTDLDFRCVNAATSGSNATVSVTFNLLLEKGFGV